MELRHVLQQYRGNLECTEEIEESLEKIKPHETAIRQLGQEIEQAVREKRFKDLSLSLKKLDPYMR